jgi:hypothetical protein
VTNRASGIMTKQLRRLSGVFLLAVAALGACRDGTGIDDSLGRVGFDYTGTASGTFLARGPAPVAAPGAGYPYVTFTSGFRSAAGGITLHAYQDLGGHRGDHLVIYLHKPVAGMTFLLQGTYCGDASANCALGLFERGIDLHSYVNDAAQMTLLSGTVRVTSLTATRIRGTFSGHAEDVRLRLETPTTPPAATADVVHGTFDVPVTDAVPSQLRAP